MIGKRFYLYGMTLAAVALASIGQAISTAAVRMAAAFATFMEGALEPFEPQFMFAMDCSGVTAPRLSDISPALYQSNRHEAGVARRAAHRHT